VLVVGLCATNVMLIKQNRELKAAIARSVKQPEYLKAGETVPPLVARTLTGERVEVDYTAAARTVLLVFSPQCSACDAVVPYWRDIEGACARNGYQIWGVSLGDGPGTLSFLRSHSLNVDSFVDLAPETINLYKLSLTPLTLVVDQQGKVQRIWAGILSKESKAEVDRYFRTT
jgi:peroxiredoxin